ncbi:MAG: SOS response-associated peptidase, partial [Dehalococcoidia bacterium]|nr:SOS response-associated peptidase [Dehalococcoidia bacterium]
MCGRYTLIADLGDLVQRFEFDGSDFSYDPGYNIAPTESVLTVRNVEGREAVFMKWGLIPFWAKDPKIGTRMINARAETVATKPSFRNALKKRRCLVLADGYYEWQRIPTGKRPYRIILKSGEPFAFAGLWETWKDTQGNIVPSCTIITTAANEYLAPIHNRMPVILTREMEETWLAPSIEETSDLAHLLIPSPDDALDAYEVSTLVNY